MDSGIFHHDADMNLHHHRLSVAETKLQESLDLSTSQILGEENNRIGEKGVSVRSENHVNSPVDSRHTRHLIAEKSKMVDSLKTQIECIREEIDALQSLQKDDKMVQFMNKMIEMENENDHLRREIGTDFRVDPVITYEQVIDAFSDCF